jgi:uncharacterized protein (DUF58 family)
MHNYNIVYLMMFFIFSLAGASSIIGRLNLYEIQASVLASQDLFANTASTYTLELYNPNIEKDAFSLECSNTKSSVLVNELRGGQTKNISLKITPEKRGKTLLPALRLGSHFPLPHEILFKDIPLEHECTVFPQPKGESLDSFSSKHLFHVGEYDDFEGIRTYREGEPLSLIYWPSLAKGGRLMAKEFSLLEKSRHLHFDFIKIEGGDEERLSQLCLWALECQKKNISYTMHFPNTSLNSTQRSHYEILQFLALY